MSRRTLILLMTIVLPISGIAAVVVLFELFWVVLPQQRLNAVPLAPANYQPAAIDLVKLTQSDPSVIKAMSLIDGSSLQVPQSIRRLNPETLVIQPDETKVFWGGGFYHCGWRLNPAKNGRNAEWELWFWNENGTEKLLETISVPKDAHFTPEELGLPAVKVPTTTNGG